MSLSSSTSHPTSTSTDKYDTLHFSIQKYVLNNLLCLLSTTMFTTVLYIQHYHILHSFRRSGPEVIVIHIMQGSIHKPLIIHSTLRALRFRLPIHFKTQFSSLYARIFRPLLRRLQPTNTLYIHIYGKNHLSLSITFLTALQRLLSIHCSPLPLDTYSWYRRVDDTRSTFPAPYASHGLYVYCAFTTTTIHHCGTSISSTRRYPPPTFPLLPIYRSLSDSFCDRRPPPKYRRLNDTHVRIPE